MSQDELFQGICIGGPLDGERRLFDQPSFKIVKERPRSYAAFVADYRNPKLNVLETVTYRHELCYVQGEPIAGMWVVEHMTLADAVTHILGSYEEHNGKNNPNR